MTSMLDNAIIDANALRETAIKNAEQLVIEKFSVDIKEAVERLLEGGEHIVAEAPFAHEDLIEEKETEEEEGKEEKMIDENADCSLEDESKEKKEEVKIPTKDLTGKDELDEVDISLEEIKDLLKEWHDEGEGDYFSTGEMGKLKAAQDANDPTKKKKPEVEPDGDKDDEIELDEEFDFNAGMDEEKEEETLGDKLRGEDSHEGSNEIDETLTVKSSPRMRKERPYSEFDIGREEIESIPHSREKTHPLGHGSQKDSFGSESSDYGTELGDEEIDLDEILDEEVQAEIEAKADGWLGTTPRDQKEALEIEKAKEVAKKSQPKEKKDDKEVLKEMKKLSDKLEKVLLENKKLINNVNLLKEGLTDLNLRNSKLFYANRILKDSSLNEKQKMKLVENLSKSESVEQTKLIYETLVSTVGSTKTKPESLSEVVNRNSSLSAKRLDENKGNDIDPRLTRMHQLAGIKK